MTEQELELVRKAQNQYRAEWRRRNPGKQAEYSKRFWLKKAKELKTQDIIKKQSD